MTMKYKKVEELSSEIKALDRLISAAPTPDLIRRRVGMQTEEGDKPSKLLASQLRQKAVSRTISQIMLPDGSSTEYHQAFNSCF